MLTTLTTFIIVLIGWTNAAPSTLRSSRSLSEKKEYGRGNAVIGGIEEVSIGHSSNTDILRMPSRQALLEQQQQQDRKMTVLETKAYEIPIDAITVSLRSWTNLVG